MSAGNCFVLNRGPGSDLVLEIRRQDPTRSTQPSNHLAMILIGASSLDDQPVGNSRVHEAGDPRRNSRLASGD